MNLFRRIGFVFSLLCIGGFSWLSYLLYVNSGGFYAGTQPDKLFVEFALHLMIISNMALSVFYFQDRKKSKLFTSFADSDADNLLDLRGQEKEGMDAVSNRKLRTRLLVSSIPFILILIVIFIIFYFVIPEGVGASMSLDDFIGFGIIGLILCGNLIPIIYHLKLINLKKTLESRI